MTPSVIMPLGTQVVWLFVLAIPVACVAWTVTHEEVLREPREICQRIAREGEHWYQRKFFYLFTCEYCFSHYISAAAIWCTGFHLLVPGAWGSVIAWFAVVWVANQYMSLFNRLRLDIKDERITIQAKTEELGQPPAD